MRRLSLLILSLFLVVAVPGLATAQKKSGQKKTAPAAGDLTEASVTQSFKDLLPNLANQDAQQKWQEICFKAGAPGNEALRLTACKLMAEKLASAPAPAQVWLLKQLQHIGKAEAVDAVAGLLNEKTELVREAAVRCLANNPAPEATAKLLAVVPAATGKVKIGLINALGFRADPAAVAVIAKELNSSDAPMAMAAARALGKIPGAEATQALETARGQAKGALRLGINDAYLKQADRLLKEGKAEAAATIYKSLQQAEEPRGTRLAALRGLILAKEDEAGAIILGIFSGTDKDAQAIAVSEIGQLKAGALGTLAAALNKLPVASQVQVLQGLGARGDKSQMPAALAAAKSSEEAVQKAALETLGRIGDATAVPLLLDALANPNLSGPAAESLAQVGGKEVSETLVAALTAEKKSERITRLMDILARRKAVEAVPALLKFTLGEDAGLRTSAFAALESVAQPKHVPDLIQSLLKTKKGSDQDRGTQTVVVLCNQTTDPEAKAEPVLVVLAKLDKADDIVVLLPILGRLGGAKAKECVVKFLATEGAQREAAVRAICSWPDGTVATTLLDIIKGSDKAQHQAVLQALARINALPNDQRPVLEKLAQLKEAMKLAQTANERKTILNGIGFVRHMDTLHYVLPYLDDKELSQAACRAVVELAHSRNLREPNVAEFNKVLDRVIALCKDRGLVDRAKEYRRGR